MIISGNVVAPLSASTSEVPSANSFSSTAIPVFSHHALNPGVSYVIGENGKPEYTELITNNPDGHSMDGMARSYGLINWPGIHNNSQLTCAIESQGVAYERWSDTDHDTHVVVHTAVLDEYLDEYTDLWTDIDLYINECRAKFISGEMSIENDFDTYLETLKSMNIDRVYEIKQITLDAHNAALAE